MLELLFLLLPIASGYGWYMGSRNARQQYQDNSNRLSKEYVDGLNFLLSNQRDKAVDLFLDLLKEDSGMLEAHLTLGNLFRSQGEIDRAIRIHQALLESASLSFEQRLLAIQQLGRDYLAAGFYDRAEEMFLQLVDEEEFATNALQQLILIYQATSEWNKAIGAAMRLVRLGKSDYNEKIAQFHCEVAADAITANEYEKAVLLLKKALTADASCARVGLMLGHIAMLQKDYDKAIDEFSQVLKQDPAFIGEAIPFLKTCYGHVERPGEFKAFLKKCVEFDPSNTAVLALADMIHEEDGIDAAQYYIYRSLVRKPNLKGFFRLMDYNLAEAEDGRAKDSLIVLRNMVGEQIKASPHYRCTRCGLTVNSLYWMCPGCRSWASVKPLRDFEHQKHAQKFDDDVFS